MEIIGAMEFSPSRSAHSSVSLSHLRPNGWPGSTMRDSLEEVAIDNLILTLAAKRAFLVGDDNWVSAEGELQCVVGSIYHARTLIRDAGLALGPRSGP